MREYVTNSGVTIWGDTGIPLVHVIFALVKGFWNGAQDAWHCGSALADVFIGLIDDSNAKGAKVNVAFAESPIYIMVSNNNSQRVGFLDNGSIVNEIPDAEVMQADDGRKAVLYPGQNTTSVTVTGSGAGYFDLSLAMGKTDGFTHNVKYRNVSVVTDTVGTIDATNMAYILRIDDNGDGAIDRTIEPNDIAVRLARYDLPSSGAQRLYLFTNQPRT